MENTGNTRYTAPGFEKLIDLPGSIDHPVLKGLVKSTGPFWERLIAIDRINQIHHDVIHQYPDELSAEVFFDAVLKELNIRVEVSATDQDKMPTDGPLVVVANHPFGGAEGIILGKLLLDRRPDTKILGNYLLNQIPQIRPCIVPVDPFENRSSVAANAGSFKTLIRWVRDGGALLTFPAGEVAHFQLRKARVTDPPWSPHIAAIIRMAKARVLPVYFQGMNSLRFQLLGMVHPLLRTLMLPTELVNKTNTRIRVHMGKAISWAQLKKFDSPQTLTDYLRFSTFFLRNRERLDGRIISFKKPVRNHKKAHFAPIAPAVSAISLEREIRSLPADCLFVHHKEFDVYCGTASQMPAVIDEIGRLREISFRDVDEGTGNAMDLDRFDEHYLHLFLWNRDKREIAGAYRLGITEEILSRSGPAGLYTYSLFRFKPEFLRRLSRSIELGRSFIRPEYQRKHGCLSLLWRGIGEFVTRAPQFRLLFGPVSISNNYHVVSRNLIVSFLRKREADTKFTPWVKPRNPLASEFIHRFKERIFQTPIGSIEDVSLLVSEIEKDGKGVPPLIKHYLKLDGKFIGFNVDRNFSNVVDGLVMVDLSRTDHRLLKRFMGDDGFRRYWRYQQSVEEKAA